MLKYKIKTQLGLFELTCQTQRENKTEFCVFIVITYNNTDNDVSWELPILHQASHWVLEHSHSTENECYVHYVLSCPWLAPTLHTVIWRTPLARRGTAPSPLPTTGGPWASYWCMTSPVRSHSAAFMIGEKTFWFLLWRQNNLILQYKM